MIELTVKTLDSFNHTFNVEAESTVEQLKEKIRDALGLEIERQRLIFCGRVLQDDQKLNDCGVDNGKCLHLVQRPPPSPPSRRRDRERERERERDNTRGDNGGRVSGSPLRHHIRHLLSAPTDLVVEQQQAMSMTPTAGRMEFIRRMITEIRESMATLRSQTGDLGGSGESAESQAEPMDTDPGQADAPIEVEEAENDGEDEDDPTPGRANRRNRAVRSMRSRFSRPRDLGQLLEELDLLHEDFAPYRARYISTLRDLTVIQYPEPERLQRQRTVTLICDIMHSFAHGYHAISDITFHVGQRYPRLTSEPPSSTRHPLPMQAHINVVTTTGRRSMSGDGRAHGRATTGTTGTGPAPTPAPAATNAAAATAAAATAAAATAAAATAAAIEAAARFDAAHESFNVRRAAAGDRGVPAGTPIHTTTRTFTQPSPDGSTPLQYQVEIETRGHIAIPFDHSLLSGLAAVASNLHQAQAQQDLAAAAQQAPQPPPSSESSASAATSTPVAPAAAPAVPLASAEPSAPSDTDSSASSTPPPPGVSVSSALPTMRPARAPTARPARARRSQSPIMVRAADPRHPTRHPFVGTPHEHLLATAGPEFTGHSTHSSVHDHTRAGTDSRPRVLMDLENLLRGLTHGGGVEVVMSMEEMPSGFMPGTIDEENNTGVYVTPLIPTPGGAAQTTEILHNVIANVLRQNIGDAILNQNLVELAQRQTTGQQQGQTQNPRQTQGQVPTQSQAPGQSQGSTRPTQNQEQTPNQRQTSQRQTLNQGLNQNQRSSLNQGQTQNQGQTRNQRPERRQDNSERRHQWQPPSPQASRRRINERAHSFAMACMVYDRYMHCDSAHARRHLQERREHYQEQAEAQERARAARAPAPEIEVLLNRNPRFTPRHMATMMFLLSGPVCEEGQLNSFMITIARHLFLDPLNENPNDPTPTPTEFPFIRMQLREYVQRMLERAIETGGRTNTFEAVTERVIAQNLDFLRSIPREHVPLMIELAMQHDGFTAGDSFDTIADHLVQQQADFLLNMASITPINTDIDPTASVRVMTRSRLPAIIACVMSEASSDMFAARFYSVFARFFTDICTLFLCFCVDGFDGLRLIFDAFIAGITESYEEPVRDWLRTVGRENLLAIRNSLEPNIDTTARQYFRRADGSMPPPACCLYQALRDDLHIAIREGSALPHICERHQTLLMPLQAPPLPAPPPTDRTREGTLPSTSEDQTRGSPPVNVDDDDTQGSDEGPSAHEPQCPLHNNGDSSSSTMSPSEPRSPGELNNSDGTSPRLFRGWPTTESPADPRSVSSELDAAHLPGGIITIGLASSDDSSLYDPDDSNYDDFIDADAPDDYEFTEMQRSLLDRQLNLLEDEEENEDAEVDVENDDGVPVTLPGRNSNRPDPYAALSEAAMRMQQSRMRNAALRRATNRLEPEQYRLMRQADLRMELRAMDQSARETEADAQLMAALERLQRIADRQTSEAENVESEANITQPEASGRTDESSVAGESLKQAATRPSEQEQGETPAPLNETIAEPESEYSTPPVNTETPIGEPEFLDPNDPPADQANEIDMSEPEFLTPVPCRRAENTENDNNQSNYNVETSQVHHATEMVCPSADADQYVTNTEGSEFSLPEYQRTTESSETSGYLTPLSRNRSNPGISTPQPMEHVRSDEAIRDSPLEEFESATAPGCGMETMRHIARLRENTTPSREPNTSELEVLTPELERSVTRDLVRFYEGNEESETHPPATQVSDDELQRITAKYAIQHTSSASTQTPMETVFEHFESNWEPVFREDGASQEARATRPQEPFSDAYLSGMPSRKRRCVRESRPDSTLDGLVNEGFRAVSEGVAAAGVAGVNPAELRQFLRESVRSLVRQRTQQEPDNYNPAQFQNTATFLEPTAKPKSKEPEGQNSMPPSKRDTPPDSVE